MFTPKTPICDLPEATDEPRTFQAAPPDTNTSNSVVDKHAEYYFADIIFLVENQLFKVPRRNFAINSEIFSDMFQLPTPTNGTPPDGSSNDRPLRLDGIKKSDFIQLLRVMFPLNSQSCNLLSFKEWTSVLKLSSMWQLEEVRAKAIKAMESPTFSMDSDLVNKIIIARRFAVSSWLVPYLNALVQREKPLDLLEGNQLGLEWVLKVGEMRECGATATAKNLEYTCQNCSRTGPPRCSSCSSTTFNRCGSCNNYINQQAITNAASRNKVEARGGRNSVDYSDKIREIFGLE